MAKSRAESHPAQLRDDFTRGEAITGLVWLSLGAIFSLLLEVVYLETYLPLGETMIPFPVTVVVAYWFNGVLTRTAALWARNDLVPPLPTVIAAIPAMVWMLGIFGVLISGSVTGDQWLPNNMWTLALLFAGVAGGVWPLARMK